MKTLWSAIAALSVSFLLGSVVAFAQTATPTPTTSPTATPTMTPTTTPRATVTPTPRPTTVPQAAPTTGLGGASI